MNSPVFTVFTPTYNRAHTLPRVYECLCLQTFKDFEWLIVDDGSTDNTAELVSVWIKTKLIKIIYITQCNQGKHVAFNLGVKSANGKLFIPLDSDDTCIPQALERFHQRWDSIPKESRQTFTGVTCLCKDEQGVIVGGPLPVDVIDGSFTETIIKLNRQGEMWGFHRTDILREFPFPVYAGEKFVPEGLVWNRISKKYKTRFINEALRDYYFSDDGLSKRMLQIRICSPKATLQYYKELMGLRISIIERFKAGINVWRFSILTRSYSYPFGLLAKYPFFMFAAAPIGAAISISFAVKKNDG